MKSGMVWSSLLGSSWIQALCIYWFYFACCFHPSTNAECQVTTKHGQAMVLATGPFPRGIYYDQIDDRFICEGPRSCEKYNFTGCTTVRCEEQHACHGAHFSHINYVGCHGYDSCANVSVSDTKMVHCGPMKIAPSVAYRTFCEQAKIHINEKYLNCMGPNACYAPWWKDRMVVNVGSKALVKCGGSNKNQQACGNMVIEVTHANRACFATDYYHTCALFCQRVEDCDTTDIEFRVVYEGDPDKVPVEEGN